MAIKLNQSNVQRTHAMHNLFKLQTAKLAKINILRGSVNWCFKKDVSAFYESDSSAKKKTMTYLIWMCIISGFFSLCYPNLLITCRISSFFSLLIFDSFCLSSLTWLCALSSTETSVFSYCLSWGKGGGGMEGGAEGSVSKLLPIQIQTFLPCSGKSENRQGKLTERKRIKRKGNKPFFLTEILTSSCHANIQGFSVA